MTDASWDKSLPPRPKSLSAEVKDAFTNCIYKSQYLSKRDGTRLACDVFLPRSCRQGTKCSVIYIQHRYMRGAAFRWPLSSLVNGLPIDFISHDLKVSLVAAGYAVVSVDVRGTGASFGRWRAPWSPEEREDSLEVLDWICKQSWSNAKVILSGISYEATAALFTMAGHHTAVKGSVLLYPFWDLYGDISFPGGVPQRSFVDAWTKVCLALDANWVGGLSLFLPIFFRGVQPVVEVPGDQESKPHKAEQCSMLSFIPGWKWCWSCCSSWWEKWQAHARAQRLVKEAVKEHASWNASKSARIIRFTDQKDPATELPVTAASPCAFAKEIAGSKTPMMLIAGWLDATASPAINAYFHSAGPGSELIIGPWTHGGILNNSPGHERIGTRSQFQFFSHIQRFLERCCSKGVHDAETPAVARLTCSQPQLAGEGQQSPSRPVILDMAASPARSDSASKGLGDSGVEEEPAQSPQQDVVAGSGMTGGKEGDIGVTDLVARALAPSTAPIRPLTGGGSCDEEAAKKPDEQKEECSSSEPVHYFTMGFKAGWRAAPRWPPPRLAVEPMQLVLSGSGSTGVLGERGAAEQHRWEHVIDSWKHPKGLSRYDAMTDMTHGMQYKKLDACGHLLFTGAPLTHALEVTGWPEVELWVESCDQDADLFCYLESYDPRTGSVAYVTEGSFRASHRKEYSPPPTDDPRAKACLPGLPFHSHRLGDHAPLQPGQPVKCRFHLLPTSFCFTPGDCVRLAISGCDTKHFQQDQPCDGSRTLWIHSGPATPSCMCLPFLDEST